jgi:hypothetical protein
MEHSAGYQEFGANLLSTLIVELETLGAEVPNEWRAKAAESRVILAWLARPDGSIPNFGDSGSSVTPATDLPRSCGDIRAGAKRWDEGYFIAWDVGTTDGPTRCAQTTVVWSSFVSNAHRRPNQLSVHYWADGVDYLQSVGYWPYGDPERLEAVGWRGSNAPHLAGESNKPATDLARKGFCAASDFRFIDLERRGVGGTLAIRRQVVDLGLAGLLVADSSEGRPGDTRESIWRVDERVAVIGPDGGRIAAGADAERATHALTVAGPSSAVIPLGALYAREGRESPEKFSAVATYGRVDPSPAYAVTSPAAQPTLVAVVRHPVGRPAPAYHFSEYLSPERWQIVDASSSLVVDRSGSVVAVTRAEGDSPSRCTAAADSSDDRIRYMETSYAQLASRYPVFHAWIPYRAKVTVLASVLFLVQLVLLAALPRGFYLKAQPYLGIALIAGWLAVGSYVELVYLAH